MILNSSSHHDLHRICRFLHHHGQVAALGKKENRTTAGFRDVAANVAKQTSVTIAKAAAVHSVVDFHLSSLRRDIQATLLLEMAELAADINDTLKDSSQNVAADGQDGGP